MYINGIGVIYWVTVQSRLLVPLSCKLCANGPSVWNGLSWVAPLI